MGHIRVTHTRCLNVSVCLDDDVRLLICDTSSTRRRGNIDGEAQRNPLVCFYTKDGDERSQFSPGEDVHTGSQLCI